MSPACQGTRVPGENPEFKVSKETAGSPDKLGPRGPRDRQGNKGSRDPRDLKDPRESKEAVEIPGSPGLSGRLQSHAPR